MIPHLSRAAEWWLLAGAVVVLIGLIGAAYRQWMREDEWVVPQWKRAVPVDVAGNVLTDDEWEQLDPDVAADTLIAEWHDDRLERRPDTDLMHVLDEPELLLWDCRRQAARIRELVSAYRVEMAGQLAWYRQELEHRRAT